MTFPAAHYEVQHFTLCDGWVNCWRTIDGEGREVPETFATEAVSYTHLDVYKRQPFSESPSSILDTPRDQYRELTPDESFDDDGNIEHA